MLTVDGSAVSGLCGSILRLDAKIRFAGIANREARLIEHAYRKGVKPLLTQKETEISILQSLIRSGTRGTLEHKLGKTIYAFARYEKVKRASIPLRNSSGVAYLLMVSFDIEADHDSIIMNKIVPLTNELVV
jgi:hypothetical protein